VQPHPQKFWFGENPANPIKSGQNPLNPRKISENLLKVPENLSRNGSQHAFI